VETFCLQHLLHQYLLVHLRRRYSTYLAPQYLLWTVLCVHQYLLWAVLCVHQYLRGLCCVAVWAVCVRAVLTSILIVETGCNIHHKNMSGMLCFWPRGLRFHPLHYGAVLARNHLTWSIAQNTQHTPCTHVAGMQVEKHVCDTPFC